MMRSLFSGVSGLKTHQTKMDVIGNNISNVNTVAFKSSSTTFQDLMYQTTSQASGATENKGGTNAKQIGLGVTNGATKISITSSGAAQSTGDALDIRLTDTKTTNFFVVSNGTENLYTRAGSFYIDGAGNLAMTTTGYLVMGYQVDPTTGDISKNGISPLKVMKKENQTSSPEATTFGTFSGVIDANDTDVNSTNGYVRSLSFYDSEGYSYTAKFSIKVTDAVRGKYSIELTNVYDDDNNDLLKNYLYDEKGNEIAGHSLSDIFGVEAQVKSSAPLNSSLVTFDSKVGGYVYEHKDEESGAVTRYLLKNHSEGSSENPTGDITSYNLHVIGDDGTVAESGSPMEEVLKEDKDAILQRIFGMSSSDKDDLVADTFKLPSLEVPAGTSPTSTPMLSYEINRVQYDLQFNTKTGVLTSAGNPNDALKTLVFEASKLGPNRDDPRAENAAISDITLDFSKMLNYDNGGTSSIAAEKGDTGDNNRGAGKKLGTMTGLSVSDNGRIYGSYSNGNTVLLGQIVVAQFANASGLEAKGDNCYSPTLNTGEPFITDISADGSSMQTGQLEMSNVDLSAEFTDMIVTQRGFQANSRIITVSDTLLEELINLKR